MPAQAIWSLPPQRAYRDNAGALGFNEEPALLAACLRSLCQQDYGGEVRVWVVDDGSDNREGDDQPGREQHLRVARGVRQAAPGRQRRQVGCLVDRPSNQFKAADVYLLSARRWLPQLTWWR
jgi:glycosyl transferase family 2